MSGNWDKELGLTSDLPPFSLLEELFTLSQFEHWPNAAGLNLLHKQCGSDSDISFVCQSDLPENHLYYEEYIYQHKTIPTRPDNWHDLFNGLIWLLFPKTKALLNRWHIEDIREVGLSPRTARRNRITHFDECGVILVCENTHVPGLLLQHQWQEAFVTQRNSWGAQVLPVVFGHANLEMLLNPFIGLTGKWLSIDVEYGFSELPKWKQFAVLDDRLFEKLTSQQLFSQSRPLRPIPLLGIPGWWRANLNEAFYHNTDYFRPLRS